MLLLAGCFVLFVLIGVPVAISVGLSAVIFILGTNMMPVTTAVQKMVVATESWPLMAIPFFILLGQLVVKGRLGTRLLNLCQSLVGHITGGLAQVSIIGSMFFAGISGSSVADAAGIGSILIPEMDKKGYDTSFSVAINASSSVIGIIIPPSIPLLVFGWMTNMSVQRLFLAGFIPGILVGLVMMAITYFIAKKKRYPRIAPPSIKELLKNLKENIFALMIPILILGSIMGGIMSTTESALAGVFYVLFIQIFVYKDIAIREIPAILGEAARLTGATLFVISTTMIISHVLTFASIPTKLSTAILSITGNKFLILIMMNLVLLAMGTVMDLMPSMMIFTPIFYPMASTLGVEPVQFGVMMTINLAIGLFTPPVGQTLYISALIGKIPIEDGAKACIPFFIGIVLVLLLVMTVPVLTTLLPSLVLNS